MKNIELKVKTEHFQKLRGLLKKSGATREGVLLQTDVYFNSKLGRLKLRTINNARSELIYYERPNKSGSKLSTYDRCVIATDQIKALRGMLKKACGESIVVIKKRELWIYKNTRVHLDIVRNLGAFVELETIIDKIIVSQARAEQEEVIRLLDLSELSKIKWSYSNLLKKIGK